MPTIPFGHPTEADLAAQEGANLQSHRVIPQRLRLDKIDTVLFAVGRTFDGVELEIYYGCKTIPFQP